MNHVRIAKFRIGKSCNTALAIKCIQPSSGVAKGGAKGTIASLMGRVYMYGVSMY
jgi:hypothetical protein